MSPLPRREKNADSTLHTVNVKEREGPAYVILGYLKLKLDLDRLDTLRTEQYPPGVNINPWYPPLYLSHPIENGQLSSVLVESRAANFSIVA